MDWKEYFRHLAMDTLSSMTKGGAHVDSFVHEDDLYQARGLCQFSISDYPEPVLVAYGRGTEECGPEDAPAHEKTPPAELTRIRKALPGLGLEELACQFHAFVPDDMDDLDEEDDSQPSEREFSYSIVVTVAPEGGPDDLNAAAQKLAQLLWDAAE